MLDIRNYCSANKVIQRYNVTSILDSKMTIGLREKRLNLNEIFTDKMTNYDLDTSCSKLMYEIVDVTDI